MGTSWRAGIVIFLFLFLVTGVVYPLLVTVIGQTLFPYQAAGNLLTGSGEKIIGSALIGQEFTTRGYFLGRPSATPGKPYNGTASRGSNLGPGNPVLISWIREREWLLQSRNLSPPYPADLVTTSASGLDPDITLTSALAQVPDIALVRDVPQEVLRSLVISHASSSLFPFPRERYVNVVLLNQDLDSLFPLPARGDER